MKKLFILAAIAMSATLSMHAQNCEMAFGVYAADENQNLTAQNINYLKNVVANALADSGTPYNLYDANFGVVVKTNVIDRQLISGAPAKTVLKVGFTMFISNMLDGKTVSSISLVLDGVGNSEEKALSNAIQKLNAQDSRIGKWAKDSKQKVIAYYDANYPTIIKEANAKAGMKEYDDAIYTLMSVPACSKGYDQAISAALDIYQKKIDQQCEENLALARAAWASGFNPENAAAAGNYLAQIYPDASCFSGAQALYFDIKKHMGEEWKFQLKQWQDNVDIQSRKLSNLKEIAIALANNQPQNVIHILK